MVVFFIICHFDSHKRKNILTCIIILLDYQLGDITALDTYVLWFRENDLGINFLWLNVLICSKCNIKENQQRSYATKSHDKWPQQYGQMPIQ